MKLLMCILTTIASRQLVWATTPKGTVDQELNLSTPNLAMNFVVK